MRLTPLDIRKQEFPQRFRGYEPEEVDTCLDLIADDVEKLLTDRNQLADRVAALEAQLTEFREIEKSLRDAFVMAEKMASEAGESAQRRADAMLREAEVKAISVVGESETRCRELLAEAENRRRSLIMELEALESQRTYAINKFRSLLEDQKAVLEAHMAPRYERSERSVGGGGRVVPMPPQGSAPQSGSSMPPQAIAPQSGSSMSPQGSVSQQTATMPQAQAATAPHSSSNGGLSGEG